MSRSLTGTGVSFQVWKASFELCTAASNSDFSTWGTRPTSSWVAGLRISNHWEVWEETHFPPISSLFSTTEEKSLRRVAIYKVCGWIFGEVLERFGGLFEVDR